MPRLAVVPRGLPVSNASWNTGSPAFAGDDGCWRRKTVLMLALEPADVLLGVEFKADAADHIELGFEEIDVMLLVLHQLLEQVARDVILDAMAVGCRLLVKGASAKLGGEVAFDDFPDVLADPQRIEHLHVGKAIEENDAVGEAVGVVHLLDRFLAPLLGELQQAPVMQ